jgi:hypothetical protein
MSSQTPRYVCTLQTRTSAPALIQIATLLRLGVRLLGLLLRRLVGRHELDDDDEQLRVGLLVLQRVSERVRAG